MKYKDEDLSCRILHWGMLISEFDRGFIKSLNDSGVKAVDIAHRMQIALSTLYKLKKTEI
jgi:predicted transcriptional regulator